MWKIPGFLSGFLLSKKSLLYISTGSLLFPLLIFLWKRSGRVHQLSFPSYRQLSALWCGLILVPVTGNSGVVMKVSQILPESFVNEYSPFVFTTKVICPKSWCKDLLLDGSRSLVDLRTIRFTPDTWLL